MNVIEWGEDTKRHIVKSERTKIIDMLVQEFKAKEIIFNLTLTDLEQYISDWQQVYRVVERNKQGIDKAMWVTIEGRRDHFAFATILWRIAMEKTYTGGGAVISADSRKKVKEHPTVGPDNKIPAIDIKEVLKRANKKRTDWRTR